MTAATVQSRESPALTPQLKGNWHRYALALLFGCTFRGAMASTASATLAGANGRESRADSSDDDPHQIERRINAYFTTIYANFLHPRGGTPVAFFVRQERPPTMILRHPQQPDDPARGTSTGMPNASPDAAGESACSRLNLLLSDSGWQATSVVDQLACLLQPLGILSYRARSGEEAASVICSRPIHIAVVDLAMPLQSNSEDQPSPPPPGGGRILQLLRRLDQPPPTVIVRPAQPAARESVRGLGEALREGAFAVVDRPVQLETMLEIMRRVIRRHYANHWPPPPPSGNLPKAV